MHERQINGLFCCKIATGSTPGRGKWGLLIALPVLGLLANTAAVAREVLGVHGNWAAFRAEDPARCYAVAAPVVAADGAFASVATWPARRIPGQLHLRLGRPARGGSAILLTIEGRPFQLVGRGVDAWASDAATDRAIVAAMRTGVSMSVAARDTAGRSFGHAFPLSGAATATDAAVLACRPR
ncbi:MAG: hypothetical protein AVDCRST_MAG91-435 [uncultured Sphingomonadaceae bacterium]|uniref:Mlr4354 like protein n=1 Tax=uncultured Sphingomonadaceae bacterium TaxID=169976 RepID=A0A6J4SCE2_9SPHN|nr:MAG: hypothetical protein AVDCRST_MAG91-435 [uncultured Sphingomonadaceae bacterium]